MKNLKLCFLLGLLLVTVGCSAEYYLEIDKDLSVKEEITLIESNDTIYSHGSSIDTFFDDTIDQLSDNYKADEYEITREIGDFESEITATRSYDHFQSLVNNNFLLNKMFSDTTMVNDSYDDDLVMVNFKLIADNNEFFIDSEDLKAQIKKITITINVPYYVTNNNADYIDQDQNIYSWYYDKETMVKDVELEFDLNKPVDDSFINQFQSLLGGGNLFTFIIIGVILTAIILGGFYLAALIKHNNSI